jgi:hypothetical protein
MTNAPPPPRNNSSIVGNITGVIGELRTSPVLLMLVLLNAAFIFAAAYFLMQLEAYRAKDRTGLIETINSCITKTVPIEVLPYFFRKSATGFDPQGQYPDLQNLPDRMKE